MADDFLIKFVQSNVQAHCGKDRHHIDDNSPIFSD